MALILFIGLIGVIFVLIFRNSILNIPLENIKLVNKLKKEKWYQNHWVAGAILFVANAVLFSSTGFVLYLIMPFVIPYFNLLIMLLAVIGSIFLWILMNKAWEGTKTNRLQMGAVGSSFYLVLSLIFVYQLVNLKPSFPGDDMFMRAIGLDFAIFVTTVAFFACFILTGFERQSKKKL